MAFLDTHNLIMDVRDIGQDRYFPQYFNRAIPVDDLKRLHDAGATTCLEFASWRDIEKHKGVCDWTTTDEMVGRCRAAGMKVLLMGAVEVPPIFDDDWYVQDADGFIGRDKHVANYQQTWGCLSPWCDDAVAYQLDWIRKFTTRYNSDDVVCIQAHSQEGESVLPPASPMIYGHNALSSYRHWIGDNHAIPNPRAPATQYWMMRSCRKVIIEQQKIYADNPTRTVSMQLHPVYMYQPWIGSGVYDIVSYFDEIRRAVVPEEFLWIVFALYPVINGKFHFESMFKLVENITHAYDLKTIVGGEWCSGLASNTPRAIASGYSAMLTAPLHPYLNNHEIDDVDINQIAASARMWE